MDTSTVLGSIGLTLSICGIIYSAINHRHIRVRLCNRLYDFSIDVDSTETKNTESEEKNTENKDLKNIKENKEEKDELKNKLKNTLMYTPHNFKIKPIQFDN